MISETEKITLNLGVVELAQIDVLAEQGIFTNRSDFIRTAIRKQLENHKEQIEQSFAFMSGTRRRAVTVGIHKITKKQLEKIVRGNDKLELSVLGMLIIDEDIGEELFSAAVEHITVRGKLIAAKEIVKTVAEMA
jgi:Arc/MetJ-type ribon-helix-helix transcriptional regulator